MSASDVNASAAVCGAQTLRESQLAELKYQPVPHDHKAFLAKAREREGFNEAHEALALQYQLAGQLLKARARVGLTQDEVAERLGNTTGVDARLESAGKHAPSLAILKRYASAVGCELQVKLVRLKSPPAKADKLPPP